jgi:virginiamycin A acetyltransferase
MMGITDWIKIKIKNLVIREMASEFPGILHLKKTLDFSPVSSNVENCILEENVKIYTPCQISNCMIGKYTYISKNAQMSFTNVGRFCSIGPNLLCGWGIHPSNGLSTSPMFYSSQLQNGVTLSKENKIEERNVINIGNDVFIGMNVTILDGVSIGDGAIIGAGAVVSKDIPPYAIAIGCPIKILRYRFDHETIQKLIKIKWWEFPDNDLQEIEKKFFNVNEFIDKFYKR